MKYIALSVVFCISCSRNTSTSTEQELKEILGESVNCLLVYTDAGYLCRSESRKYYYCPESGRSPCFFTNRLVLLDAPAEAPISKSSGR